MEIPAGRSAVLTPLLQPIDATSCPFVTLLLPYRHLFDQNINNLQRSSLQNSIFYRLLNIVRKFPQSKLRKDV